MNKNMEAKTRVYDLEKRLIDFGVMIMKLVELLPKNKAGDHIGGQLIRSGTSPALNYGEAQVAESRNDFIHKMRICAKELKETRVALQFVKEGKMMEDSELLQECDNECTELVRIFVSSIQTAKSKK